ncbi:hypothetical protein ACLMJK_007140 [Lecanora helva]
MRNPDYSPSLGADPSDSIHPTITEEVQDLIMSSDGEALGTFDPPPHIAARIYRSTANRRKSSAASSRRNSMSSHHSSRSARSAHGGPQSTHIAQHLRRASIIQSRKDKAADRNAHAEKVRLRAAMAKAAPRVTTNSEERALAAKQARERYLAQVKANCAEEVKRSKRVAEEQREKRAAEHLKLKEDLEERHAEAERRKALLDLKQRRTRTVSLPTVEEKKVTTYVWKPRNDLEAAGIIQRAWQNRQRRRGIQQFLDLGLTVELVQKTSFEEIGSLLAQDNVLSCTAKLLKLCNLTHGDDDEVAGKAAVRTFLSTFLILGHPAHVLSKEGEQEQDLTDKAKALLSNLNRVLEDHPSSTSFSTHLTELSGSYRAFQTAFAGWKTQDSSYLVSHMVAQFAELDAIWQTVKNDKEGMVAEDYKEGIQQNQALILVRLKRLAGPEKAMKMIRDAIRASRKSRAKKKPVVNSRPRVTPNEETHRNVPPDFNLTGATTSEESLPAKKHLESHSPLPDNRTLMHELAINREYKLDLDTHISKQEVIIDTIRSSMQQGLDSANAEVMIPYIAKMILERLLRLLTPGNSLHVLISEALDPQMVATQVKNGAFSYDQFFSFMNTILPKLCAPVRDPDVKDLAEKPSQDPVQQLARIYYVIDLLLVDHMNFILMSSTPGLLEGTVGYEQREFMRRLGSQFPEKTLHWWKSAVTKAKEEPPRKPSNTSASEALRITPDRIYMHGLVDLAIATTDLPLTEIPETLELDCQRLNRIRSDTLRIIATSSILLTAKNLLRRDVRSLWKNESQRMWELTFSSPAAAYISIIESRYALPPTTKTQLVGTITRLLTEAQKPQLSHPVLKVLLKKIQSHVFARLAAASSEERIRTTSMAAEVLGSSGMPEFVGRVGDIIHELSGVADVDRTAHGQWYDEVAKKAAEGAVESS